MNAWKLEEALNHFVQRNKEKERPFYQMARLIDGLIKQTETPVQFVDELADALDSWGKESE